MYACGQHFSLTTFFVRKWAMKNYNVWHSPSTIVAVFLLHKKTLKNLVNQTWTIQKQQWKWRENKQNNKTGEKRRLSTGERLYIAPWQMCEFSARFKADPQRNHWSMTKLGVNRPQIWNWICGDESEVIADDVMICLFIFTLCWWVEKKTSFFGAVCYKRVCNLFKIFKAFVYFMEKLQGMFVLF